MVATLVLFNSSSALRALLNVVFFAVFVKRKVYLSSALGVSVPRLLAVVAKLKPALVTSEFSALHVAFVPTFTVGFGTPAQVRVFVKTLGFLKLFELEEKFFWNQHTDEFFLYVRSTTVLRTRH